MATKGEEEILSKEAAGDLSSDQHKFVEQAADGQVQVVSGAGNAFLGILENKPSAEGEAATVRFDGTGKVIAGESINEGDYIASNGSGQAVTATAANVDTTTSNSSEDVAGDHVGGIATEAASSGEKFKVALSPMGLV